MTKSKFYLIALVTAMLLSVVLCSSPSFAAGTSSMNQQEATITIPLTQWNELMQAKLQSMKQEVTLNEMQNSLTELKGQIENDKKTIKRLRMQRNVSQVLSGGAIIGIAFKH